MHLSVWKNGKLLKLKKMGNYSSVNNKLNYLYKIKKLFLYYQFAYVDEINLLLSNHSVFKGDDQVLVKFSKINGFTCLLEKPD